MIPLDLAALIAQVPLFASLPIEERIHLANTLLPRQFEKDTLY
jgi:hypothetical protein